MLAPSLCLRQPDRGGRKRKTSLANIVNKQCSIFRSSFDPMSLVTSSDLTQSKTKKNMNDDSRLASAISRKLDEGDIRGAVRFVSSSDTFNEATLSKLREKHPPAPAIAKIFW